MSCEQTSHIKDEWVRVAQQLRLKIEARMADIPAMTPSEIDTLVASLAKAQQLEVDSLVFDDWVQWRVEHYKKPSWSSDD